VFNCADYADNPELLSASLFGYIKGSFTGADGDHIGSLESADGGYLFLDEVHRLSPEGQEKLFVFMDQGVFKRLGESKAERKANVR
ncbi:MAG: sigma 54-interacting transcriptional regulator, partial [Erysipelotrichaceae bacterium]